MDTGCGWVGKSPKILPLRCQAQVVDGWLKHRLDNLLPQLMRREQFDMWVVTGREYNEDPVLLTLLPAAMLSARRRTILVFCLCPDGTVERLALNRTDLGDLYSGVWDPDREDQWECLGRLVRERDPGSIGVNYSETFALGDGLSYSEHGQLVRALGPVYVLRARSAEKLAVGWLEKRSGPELDAYTGIVELAHQIVAEAFSSRVVHPGVTTVDDVSWWIRQRIHDQGFRAWFHPTVSLQRHGEMGDVIRPGDLLHCDVGLMYLGLATDTQQHAYVLRMGEQDAPGGLKAALATGNRLQDILAGEFVAQRTGNEILARALDKARSEGIKASIYTHPLGYHGHGAGPVIGLWDMQRGVPGRGDYPLYGDTCHAMELNIHQAVPEWGGQEIRIALEQDIVFSRGTVHYLAGRQTAFHLIA